MDDVPDLTEKAAFLKSVSIFVETPTGLLPHLAALLEPVDARAGEMIIEQDGPDDSLYIVRHGRVRVHQGDRTLTELGAYAIFGEMSLLDDQPRAASVTAVEDTQLYQLDQAVFFQLMAERPEVARGVIRGLVRYLRVDLAEMAHDFEYMQQIERLTTAAATLETGHYEASLVETVARRSDALGRLARVFQGMASEVVAREQRLRNEVQQLRIVVDQAHEQRQVAEIVESDYFRQLERKAEQLREQIRSGGSNTQA